jgi:MOSC domain-containing protein YiiM
MTMATNPVGSDSIGDPACFVPLDELRAGLAGLAPAAQDVGRVAVIVRRGAGGRREVLERSTLSPAEGVPGDAWLRRGAADPQMQIATMQVEVAELIANSQPLTLFGDNLFLELDLSAANLPVGSQVRIGHATVEVTPMPHNGCRKFQARFGPDALRFVSMAPLRERNLRGIYFRVIQAGEVRSGDSVQVLTRAQLTEAHLA